MFVVTSTGEPAEALAGSATAAAAISAATRLRLDSVEEERVLRGDAVEGAGEVVAADALAVVRRGDPALTARRDHRDAVGRRAGADRVVLALDEAPALARRAEARAQRGGRDERRV